ncbi:MAG: hypothetical protein ACP5VQ_09930 [Phycisphaerae bacterium]
MKLKVGAAMGCLVIIFGFFWPRVALVLLWLFSDYPQRAFQGMLFPLLGFLFLPTTTLGYELAMNWSAHGLTGLWWLLPALGLLHDLGHLGYSSQWKHRPTVTKNSAG